jgi:hypothetical protein
MIWMIWKVELQSCGVKSAGFSPSFRVPALAGLRLRRSICGEAQLHCRVPNTLRGYAAGGKAAFLLAAFRKSGTFPQIERQSRGSSECEL